MKKKQPKKTNGTIFKTIVRSVVKEELKPVEKRLDKTESLLERLDEKIDNSFRKYRDDVLTGLDPVMGELKAIREEQAAHFLNHEDINDRLDTLESIHPQGQHGK